MAINSLYQIEVDANLLKEKFTIRKKKKAYNFHLPA